MIVGTKILSVDQITIAKGDCLTKAQCAFLLLRFFKCEKCREHLGLFLEEAKSLAGALEQSYATDDPFCDGFCIF